MTKESHNYGVHFHFTLSSSYGERGVELFGNNGISSESVRFEIEDKRNGTRAVMISIEGYCGSNQLINAINTLSQEVGNLNEIGASLEIEPINKRPPQQFKP